MADSELWRCRYNGGIWVMAGSRRIKELEGTWEGHNLFTENQGEQAFKSEAAVEILKESSILLLETTLRADIVHWRKPRVLRLPSCSLPLFFYLDLSWSLWLARINFLLHPLPLLTIHSMLDCASIIFLVCNLNPSKHGSHWLPGCALILCGLFATYKLL